MVERGLIKIYKYKKREGKLRYLVVTLDDFGGVTFETVKKKMNKDGKFGVPFHFFISRHGKLSKGRPLYAVAGADLIYSGNGIHVCVDSERFGTMTESQHNTLDRLLEQYEKLELVQMGKMF